MSRMHRGPVTRRAGRAAAGTAAGLVAVHLGPALTSLAPRRRAAFLPSLCGLSRTGHLALTFDDGPDPRGTPAILDALDVHSVSATFFVLGAFVAHHRDIVAETARRGHEVAVHGWDHGSTVGKAPRVLRDELVRTAQVVAEVTGQAPRWYRPPYGVETASSRRAAHAAGLRTVLWTTWGVDWSRRATPASVVARIRRDAHPGGTVLLHDSDRTSAPGSWRVTRAATVELLDGWSRDGIPVGPLRDHGL